MTAVCGCLSLSAATLGGTNVWTGVGGDFKWSNDANWRAVDCTGAEVPPKTFRIGTVPCVFDFSALPSGTTVTNDLVGQKVFPMGFVFRAEAVGDTWTLAADRDCFAVSRVGNVNHDCVCLVPEGATLNYGLRVQNNYSGEGDFTVSGGGTLNLNSPGYFAFKQRLVVKDSTLTLDAALDGLDRCWIALEGDAARLVLGRDATILGLLSQGEGSPSVELGAYTLTQSSGFADSNYVYGGRLSGTGGFVLSSGVLSTLTQPCDLTGRLTLGNSDLSLGPGAALGSAASAQFDFSGRLRLSGDQTLKAVMGAGVTGGVDVPVDATLTLTGEAGGTAAFSGRFVGEGTVSVEAPGFAYELDSASRHEARLRIASGTVVLASAEIPHVPAIDDAEVYLNFENDLCADASTNGYAYACDRRYNNWGYVGSVSGTGAVQGHGMAGRGADLDSAQLSGPAANISGNVDQSVAFWFRTDAAGVTNLFQRSDWKNQIYIRLENAHGLSVRYNYDEKFGGQVSYASPTALSGTGWHHVALTYAASVPHVSGRSFGQLRLYVDGLPVASELYNAGILKNETSDALVFGSGDAHVLFDEIKFVGRRWSDAEVAAEYARCRSYLLAEEECLPAPVAHWAFDDAENPGKDSSGNGYDLSVPEKLTLYAKDGSTYEAGALSAPAIKAMPGAYGLCAQFSGNYNSGCVLTADSFPAKISTGNAPFAISVRFQDISQAGPTLVGWGDVAKTRGNVRVALGGSPSGVVCSSTSNGSSHNGQESVAGYGSFFATGRFTTGGNLGQRGNWSHVVFVWSPDTREMRCYFDGRLYETAVYTPDAASGLGALDLAAQDLIVGCNRKATNWGNAQERFFGGCIDDIQIFDCALDAGQVERLTRNLGSETQSSGTSLAVASDATLEVRGLMSSPLASLVTCGTLTVDGAARLAVASGTIGGTVNGCGVILANGGTVSYAPTSGSFTGILAARNGSLVISSAAPGATVALLEGGSVRGDALTADVAIPEGFRIVTDATKRNLPVVSTSGRVTVPATATVRVEASFEELAALSDRFFPIACGDLALPDDFGGWTLDCDDARIRMRLRTRREADGRTTLYAKVAPHSGALLIVR